MGVDAGSGVFLCDRYAVADVDSHIIEPPDLWTSRVASKWGDLVPHVRYHERRAEDWWFIGSQKLYGVGAFAASRMERVPTFAPPEVEGCPPGGSRSEGTAVVHGQDGHLLPVALPEHPGLSQPRVSQRTPQGACNRMCAGLQRLARRVLFRRFPATHSFDDAPVLGCRCVSCRDETGYDIGHKGVLFAARYDKVGFPRLVDDYWEPLLSQAQEMELSMNFHVGFLASSDDTKLAADQSKKLDYARDTTSNLLATRRKYRRGGDKRGLPPLPRSEVRLRGERSWLASVPGGEHGLAVAERRRTQGLP